MLEVRPGDDHSPDLFSDPLQPATEEAFPAKHEIGPHGGHEPSIIDTGYVTTPLSSDSLKELQSWINS